MLVPLFGLQFLVTPPPPLPRPQAIVPGGSDARSPVRPAVPGDTTSSAPRRSFRAGAMLVPLFGLQFLVTPPPPLPRP